MVVSSHSCSIADRRLERGRKRVSFAIAGLVHLSFALAIAKGSVRETVGQAPPSRPGASVGEVDLELVEVRVSPMAARSGLSERPAAKGAGRQGSSVERASEPASSQERGGIAAAAPTPFAGIVLTNAASAHDELALDGPNPLFYVGDAPREAEVAPARVPTSKERVDASLRKALLDSDQVGGLGPEGPVRTALADATYAGRVPTHGGAASFRIVANGAGEVIALGLVGSPDAREAWADVAKAALAALKGKRLRMASTPGGAVFRIDVSVDVKLPNGQDPGLEVSVFGRVLKKGEGKSSTKIALLDLHLPSLSPFKSLKEATPAQLAAALGSETRRLSALDATQRTMHEEDHRQIRAPGNEPVLGPANSDMTIFGANPDPSNIGASARTIVHTRLVDITAVGAPP